LNQSHLRLYPSGMKQIIFGFWFFFTLVLSETVHSQDTIRAPITIENREFFTHTNILSECAHGHICCQAGCSCCTELKRAQVYDTIVFPALNGIQRLKIYERYEIAATHDKYSTHFRFRDSTGTLSVKYYDVLKPRFFYDLHWQENKTPSPEPTEFLVEDPQGSYLLLDSRGQELPLKYATHRKLSDNLYLSSILIHTTRIYGFTDGKGNRKGPMNIVQIDLPNEHGHVIFLTNQGKQGVMDSLGNILIPCRFNMLKYIGSHRYEAVLENDHGIVDENGRFLYVSTFSQVGQYSEGLIFVQKDKDLIAYVDLQGNEKLVLKANWGLEFQDGFAPVFKNEKWGYIDTNGKVMIAYQFEQALGFYKGTAPVRVFGTERNFSCRLINKEGKFINDKVYYDILPFKAGFARAFINGSGYGLLDEKGNEFLPCKYNMEDYGTQTDWFVHDRLVIREVKSQSAWIIDKNKDTISILKPYIAGYFVHDHSRANAFLPYIYGYSEQGQQLLDLNGKPLLKKDYRSVQMLTPNLLCIYTDQKQNGFLFNLQTQETILKLSESEQLIRVHDGIIAIQKSPEYSYPEIVEHYDLEGNLLPVYEIRN